MIIFEYLNVLPIFGLLIEMKIVAYIWDLVNETKLYLESTSYEMFKNVVRK